MYKYNEEFYSYIGGGAVESAKIIIPLVLKVLSRQVDSVLDVGCGAGAWLSVWKDRGSHITGIDGGYVNRDLLMIAPDAFVEQDLRFEFSLPQRYDLVQCLEVAEHLPSSSAHKLVASLCRHSDIVVFSAAPPGQGGENHINEQAYSYWRDLFDKNNFQMYDCLRPHLTNESMVMPWYRYNIFVYINRKCFPETQKLLMGSSVARDTTPRDVSPALYQFRKLAIRNLPVKFQTMLAIIKKKFKNTFSK